MSIAEHLVPPGAEAAMRNLAFILALGSIPGFVANGLVLDVGGATAAISALLGVAVVYVRIFVKNMLQDQSILLVSSHQKMKEELASDIAELRRDGAVGLERTGVNSKRIDSLENRLAIIEAALISKRGV